MQISFYNHIYKECDTHILCKQWYTYSKSRLSNAKKSHLHKAFVSLYAMLLSLSISLVALHTVRFVAIKKEITLGLYFQKQSQLYAKSLKDIVIQCLKNHNLSLCEQDRVQFDPYFHGQYHITQEKIHDNTHPNYQQKVLLLDISIYSQTLLSTHPLQYARRYVLKGYTK